MHKYAATALVTAPVLEPLTRTEVKLVLRREDDFTADDALFTRLIKAARLYCEKFLNRKLITQTHAAWFDSFPCSDDVLELPFPPLIAVDHLKYVDTSGSMQTWTAATNYLAQTGHEPGRIIPQYGISWPSIRDTPSTDADMLNGPVRVQFQCGYGTAGSSVPEDIRTAMHLLIGYWYVNREADAAAQVSDSIRSAVEALLWPERIVRF